LPTSKPVRLPVKRIAPAGLKVSMAAAAALVATLPTCYGWVCRLPFTLAAGLVSIAVDCIGALVNPVVGGGLGAV
jgi:hypothetical protein